ncbi:phosphatase PAP2 family protein [Planomonospora algeriensis]
MISAVFNPRLLLPPLLPLVGLVEEGRAGLLWGLAATVVCTGVPLAVFTVMDVRDGNRKKVLPLAIAAAVLIACLVAFAAAGAPLVLMCVVASMLAGLVSKIPVARSWDVSWHSSIAAGFAVWMVYLFGPWAVPAAVAAAVATAWSRVQLGEHTPAQVVVGLAQGAGTPLLILAVFS